MRETFLHVLLCVTAREADKAGSYMYQYIVKIRILDENQPIELTDVGSNTSSRTQCYFFCLIQLACIQRVYFISKILSKDRSV